MDENDSEDEALSEDEDVEDDEMSDDDGPDDDMTLIQYQEEARRDALIRKSSHANEVSPKKGRVEAGSSCS